ncbi:hypothetical protein C2845_PM04G17700 [Panicum miliaceum]|uniref:Nicotianamine synthase n=1 Tax=Panicum miliaceum TaxID=4540 RepID=A0A3L6QSA4_PANMI|nr:hypothetical protein C2845_PM04G17700 [Panicum miliaceum]
MSFRIADAADLTEELVEYDVVFLAALVGMTAEDKVAHLRWHKARAVYHYHPDNEVINSVIVAREKVADGHTGATAARWRPAPPPRCR